VRLAFRLRRNTAEELREKTGGYLPRPFGLAKGMSSSESEDIL
jgi:hypothetical protein